MPVEVRERLRRWRQIFRLKRWLILDKVQFALWLILVCLKNRKSAVVIRRMDALGDVVCTLPMCQELRKIHSEHLLIYLTTPYCEGIIKLSNSVDLVFSARCRNFLPGSSYFGFLRKLYNPQTTDERGNSGAKMHLIDDLSESCGINPRNRQPRLYPSPELIFKVQDRFKIAEARKGGSLLIAINCGPTWPVREWSVLKWQALINRIHMAYDATLIRFGIHVSGKTNQYDRLEGAIPLAGRLNSEELIALISECDLVLSIDSGPVHVAGAVRVPVVAVFGAVNPAFRLPPESRAEAITSNVPCLFCHHETPMGHWKSGCPYEIRCMEELEVEPVFLAVCRMIEETKGIRARE